MRTTTILATLVVLTLVSSHGRGIAQSSYGDAGGLDQSGMSLGVQLYSSWVSTAEPGEPGALRLDENGGGLAFTVGYRFRGGMETRVVLGGAAHDTSDPDVVARIGSLSLEARYRFRATARARPYVAGGVGGIGLVVSDGPIEANLSGAAASLGAGLELTAGRHATFLVGLRHDFINWNQLSVELRTGDARVETSAPVEEASRAARIELGFGWGF